MNCHLPKGCGDGEYETVGIAPEVERFRAVFEKYARQEGVFDQVNIIMALTMQESGGRSLDIMQSSESIGLPPNSITDPEYSIEVGIKHFKKVFKQAGGDIRLTLQAYNFGSGFIDYVKKTAGNTQKNWHSILADCKLLKWAGRATVTQVMLITS